MLISEIRLPTLVPNAHTHGEARRRSALAECRSGRKRQSRRAPSGAKMSSAWKSSPVQSRFPGQLEQPVAVDMLLEVIGQQVERGIDVEFVGEGRRLPADSLQPMLALPVVGQKAVDVAA